MPPPETSLPSSATAAHTDAAAAVPPGVFESHPADGAAEAAVPENADAGQATKAHLRETIKESEVSTEELKASNEFTQTTEPSLRT